MTAFLAVTGGSTLERLSRVDEIDVLRKAGGRGGCASTRRLYTICVDGSGQRSASWQMQQSLKDADVKARGEMCLVDDV